MPFGTVVHVREGHLFAVLGGEELVALPLQLVQRSSVLRELRSTNGAADVPLKADTWHLWADLAASEAVPEDIDGLRDVAEARSLAVAWFQRWRKTHHTAT
jgi:hypothetical protein